MNKGNDGNNQGEVAAIISQKTRAGDFWGRKGALALARSYYHKLFVQAGSDRERAVAQSSLSSVYYSAAGNARSKFELSARFLRPFRILTHLRMLAYLQAASNLSDRVVALSGGLSGMTLAELDVRQSILRMRARWEDAHACIDEALSRNNIPAETHALLYAGLAQCSVHLDVYSTQDTRNAWTNARMYARRSSLLTQVRIHRAYGKYLYSVNEEIQALSEFMNALQITEEAGNLGDQIIKIRADMKRLGF